MDRALRQRIAGLLNGQKLGILATQGRSHPYQSIVAFAVDPDLKTIVFATRRGTRKYGNLKERRQVALFFDDRANREADFREATGITALGTAREMRGNERARAARRLLRRHPFLKGFLAAPDCAVFAVRVRAYVVVLRFETVIEARVR